MANKRTVILTAASVAAESRTGQRFPLELPIKIRSHDSAEHRKRVLSLSERLRSEGVDAQIDQYIPGTPAEGWPRWMRIVLNSLSLVSPKRGDALRPGK